jgi:acid stress-induced BolA-like protein IbaG/YrbA
VTAQGIGELIRGALPDADVEVVDVKGTGDHFEARVVSAAFEGLSMIEQHQRVYAPLKAHLATGELHALALKTYTPSAWSRRPGGAT